MLIRNRLDLFRRCAAEFTGTFGLVFAGTGAIMVDQISGGVVTNLGIGLTFGLVVAAMIYSLGHVSGAHINPAVTLGFAIARRFPWREVPFYWGAQLGGAVAASLVLWGLLGNTADMGATTPSGSVWQSFGAEILLTFFLMLVIIAIATDPRARTQAAPIAIGATVALEATFAGPISGASMNPRQVIRPGSGGMGLGPTTGYIGWPQWSGRHWLFLLYKFLRKHR